jgi:hypothetical protein
MFMLVAPVVNLHGSHHAIPDGDGSLAVVLVLDIADKIQPALLLPFSDMQLKVIR